MLDAVCRQDSYFLSEGFDLINNEFQRDYNTYFSILQLIASGMTQRTEIDGVLQKSMGVYLKKLENDYEMISRQQPLKAKPGSKITRYQIKDPFLRFWFRFIYPNLDLVENHRSDLLLDIVKKGYDVYSGLVLERYFQQKLWEEERFTIIGNWWDSKGENEIDIVAVNRIDRTARIAEVKINRNKISMPVLKEKSQKLIGELKRYQIEYTGYSLEDM